MKPLEGILMLEFCQFMAGPSAGLRLADLGARVIKIERPKYGEGGRQIAIKNLFIEGDSLVFHTVNRNKESYTANLKDPADLKRVKRLIEKADVMTHNFRPGVMEKIGLAYQTVKEINNQLIYATVTGYGTEGPWAKKPGQDLLIQCLSGLANLSGNAADGPTPFGLATADIVTGSHLVHGIMAALVRRQKIKKGALVEVSLLESMLDFQFELITTYLSNDRTLMPRAKKGNAHAALSAPYGIYKTSDGYISLAMGSLLTLAETLGSQELLQYTDQKTWFTKRDKIMEILSGILIKKTTKEWLDILESKNIWSSDVFTYKELLKHEGYRILGMDQELKLSSGAMVHTTRCPIQFNDKKIFAAKPAPKIGENTKAIIKEFNL